MPQRRGSVCEKDCRYLRGKAVRHKRRSGQRSGLHRQTDGADLGLESHGGRQRCRRPGRNQRRTGNDSFQCEQALDRLERVHRMGAGKDSCFCLRVGSVPKF